MTVPIGPAQRAAALAGLRSGNNQVPPLTDFAVLSSVDMSQLTEPTMADLLRGQTLEIWQTADPAQPFAATVYNHDLSVQMLLICQLAPNGVYLRMFTPDGGTSAHGPFPDIRRPDAQWWTSFATEGAVASALRGAMAKRGEPIVSDRVRAAGYEPLARLARAGALVPLVESWVVWDRIDAAGGVPGAVIEVWTGTMDMRTDPPNPYRTPLVAVGLDPFGAIVAMAAMEAMPQMHEDAYLIWFQDGNRMNMGSRPDLLDPRAFRDAARPLLDAAIAARSASPTGGNSFSVAVRGQLDIAAAIGEMRSFDQYSWSVESFDDGNNELHVHRELVSSRPPVLTQPPGLATVTIYTGASFEDYATAFELLEIAARQQNSLIRRDADGVTFTIEQFRAAHDHTWVAGRLDSDARTVQHLARQQRVGIQGHHRLVICGPGVSNELESIGARDPERLVRIIRRVQYPPPDVHWASIMDMSQPDGSSRSAILLTEGRHLGLVPDEDIVIVDPAGGAVWVMRADLTRLPISITWLDDGHQLVAPIDPRHWPTVVAAARQLGAVRR